jgi:hypothetical protein
MNCSGKKKIKFFYGMPDIRKVREKIFAYVEDRCH